MSKSAPPPGTSDIFPAETAAWLKIENAARKVFSLYGYGELRTPVFEYTEVFQRGLGGETEVVKKEMYTFEDRGGRSLTLRPEGTAGVMRCLSGTEAMNGVETRVFYIGPMFRGERPAAGRKRQFHQIGVENVGRVAPELDAESIAMLAHFLESIGIQGFKLLINTRGVAADRVPAEAALRDYFKSKLDTLCEDCKTRFANNIWRILDCKQPQCQEAINAAPDATAFFSQESKDYFKRVCESLDRLGIEYSVEPRLVRGLDYYVHTVFELTHPGLGAQNAIAGGGRYELNLGESSKPVVGVGFAAGIERLLMVQDALGVAKPELETPKVFLISLGRRALDFNIALAARLRHAGVNVALEVEEKSMKSQMRSADRVKAASALIVGDSELAKSSAVLKDMRGGAQRELPFASLEQELGKS